MTTNQLVSNLNLLETAARYWLTIQAEALGNNDFMLYLKSENILVGLFDSLNDYDNELTSRES